MPPALAIHSQLCSSPTPSCGPDSQPHAWPWAWLWPWPQSWSQPHSQPQPLVWPHSWPRPCSWDPAVTPASAPLSLSATPLPRIPTPLPDPAQGGVGGADRSKGEHNSEKFGDHCSKDFKLDRFFPWRKQKVFKTFKYCLLCLVDK